jgi:hypothetical protein
MPKRSQYVATIGCLVLLLTAALTGGVAEAKKKKKRSGGGPAVATKTVNQLVPDAVQNGFMGTLYSTIEIGKRFRGKTIGDVNLTIQTLGASAESANDIRFRLTAPNGATVFPFSMMIGASIGPLTMDDETPVQTCADPNPPCFDPDRTLGPPYAGTASTGDLFRLDGGPIRGTWTLRVVDLFPMETSTLVFWRLTVTPERPAR